MHTHSLAIAPFRSLLTWLSSAPARPSASKPLRALPAAPVRPVELRSRPLRVLRVMDGPQERSAAGRMVISGRFADVCAELDRLAAAARH